MPLWGLNKSDSFIAIKTAEGSMNAFKNEQVMNKQIIYR